MTIDRRGATGSAAERVVERALAALDLETKVRLLSGQDFWTLPAAPEIGLGSLVMSDGPIGVRGVRWAPDDPSIALPSPTANPAGCAGSRCSARSPTTRGSRAAAVPWSHRRTRSPRSPG